MARVIEVIRTRRNIHLELGNHPQSILSPKLIRAGITAHLSIIEQNPRPTLSAGPGTVLVDCSPLRNQRRAARRWSPRPLHLAHYAIALEKPFVPCVSTTQLCKARAIA